MKISEIYDKYNIPVNLQEHMYRVAAVGIILVRLLKDKIDLDEKIVTTTLLLHDMGNIIKFDLSENNGFFTKEELEYWKVIQKEFISKFGNEEHRATEIIMKEVGVPSEAYEILSNIGSSKVDLTVESDDWYRKICSYSDFRVAPYGVVSIDQRWDDVLKRYKGRGHALADIQKSEEKRKNCLTLEKQIQEMTDEPLSEIDDLKIEPILDSLKDYYII